MKTLRIAATTHILVLALLLANRSRASAVVLTFDDIPGSQTLTGTNYAGLSWEPGNTGYAGYLGYWMTSTTVHAQSLLNVLANGWGCTQIGIGFPAPVDVQGAYITEPSAGVGTTGLRVHGYRSGAEINTTAWFSGISTSPAWFAMNLQGVDRIVFESVPRGNGSGWFEVDNLTYTPEPATLSLLALGGLLMARRRRA
jgi:hypothetical protein